MSKSGLCTEKVAVKWEPYRPSNGTEGDLFQEAWCVKCKRDQAYQDSGGNEPGCPLIARSMAFDIGDPQYPKEWRRQVSDRVWPGTAECTAFEAIGAPERCKHTADMFGE